MIKRKEVVGIILAVLFAGCGLVKVNGKPLGSNELATSGGSTSNTSDGESVVDGSPHDKFSVLDIKIGMPIKQEGFICAKTAEDSNRHCVKFLDSRCTGKATAIGRLAYTERAAIGCFFDYSSEGSYIDGELLQQPSEVLTGEIKKTVPAKRALTSLHIWGTTNSTSKIYDIDYQIPYDDLTESSKLYKALVAKYGEPSQNSGGRLKWQGGTTEVIVDCQHENCKISVEDRNFERNENRKQEEADEAARRNRAPDPSL
jgi:hypothetical protein